MNLDQIDADTDGEISLRRFLETEEFSLDKVKDVAPNIPVWLLCFNSEIVDDARLTVEEQEFIESLFENGPYVIAVGGEKPEEKLRVLNREFTERVIEFALKHKSESFEREDLSDDEIRKTLRADLFSLEQLLTVQYGPLRIPLIDKDGYAIDNPVKAYRLNRNETEEIVFGRQNLLRHGRHNEIVLDTAELNGLYAFTNGMDRVVIDQLPDYFKTNNQFIKEFVKKPYEAIRSKIEREESLTLNIWKSQKLETVILDHLLQNANEKAAAIEYEHHRLLFQEKTDPNFQKLKKEESAFRVEEAKRTGRELQPFFKADSNPTGGFSLAKNFTDRSECDYLRAILPAQYYLKSDNIRDAYRELQNDFSFIQTDFCKHLFKEGISQAEIFDLLKAVPDLTKALTIEVESQLIRVSEATAPCQAIHWDKEDCAWSVRIAPQGIPSADRDKLIKGLQTPQSDLLQALKSEGEFPEAALERLEKKIQKRLNAIVESVREEKPFEIKLATPKAKRADTAVDLVIRSVRKEEQKETGALIKERDALSRLNSVNRKTFDLLTEAYQSKPEFQENPRLIDSLRRELIRMLSEAQEKGVTLQPLMRNTQSKTQSHER